MRITNSMMIDNFLSDMGRSMSTVNKYNNQILTGKKLARISDDPIRLVSAMNARQMMSSYEQYKENLNTARTWVSQSETALMDISGALTTIREQVVFANTDTNGEVDREAVARLVEQYRDHIMQSMNTTISGKYIFGGYNHTKKPFEIDADGKVLYNGIDVSSKTPGDADILNEDGQRFQLEIGHNVKMEVSFTGVQLNGVGEDNVLNVLNNLIGDLRNGGDGDQLGKYITKLEKAEAEIMDKVVTVGARSTKLDILEDRYSQDIINYDSIRGKVEDADEAEAIMRMKMADSIYKQALSVGAKIIVPTLMDYLR